eukprot:m51a1_g9912 hypothetical protein (234) ;mRNA; r:127906-128607
MSSDDESHHSGEEASAPSSPEPIPRAKRPAEEPSEPEAEEEAEDDDGDAANEVHQEEEEKEEEGAANEVPQEEEEEDEEEEAESGEMVEAAVVVGVDESREPLFYAVVRRPDVSAAVWRYVARSPRAAASSVDPRVDPARPLHTWLAHLYAEATGRRLAAAPSAAKRRRLARHKGRRPLTAEEILGGGEQQQQLAEGADKARIVAKDERVTPLDDERFVSVVSIRFLAEGDQL